MDAGALISKSAYAQHRNLSPARIAQYIATGVLDDALFHANGTPASRGDRYAKIHRDLADQALRRTLNVNQVLGQGKAVAPAASAPMSVLHQPVGEAQASPPPTWRPAEDDAAAKIQEERVKQERIKTRRMEEEEKARVGTYTLTAQVRSEVGRSLSDLLATFEAFVMDDLLAEIATAASNGTPLDQRALRLLTKPKLRAFRAARAQAARDRRGGFEQFISESEEDEPPE